MLLMRCMLICLVLIGAARQAFSQNDIYVIIGPTALQCGDEFGQYFIESNQQFVSTTWSITPAELAELVNPGTFQTGVIFSGPGSYVLSAQSVTFNGDTLSAILHIIVDYQPFVPLILGCTEKDSLSACYRVCAFDKTILQFPASDHMEVSVTGAETYHFSPMGFLEIQWGSGGMATVVIADRNCVTEHCFQIVPLPVADFNVTPAPTGDTLIVCRNQQIYFENTSHDGLAFQWSFGDGGQSFAYDAAHAFREEGVFTVKLSAGGICQCADEKELIVMVLPDPAPVINCVYSVCPGTRQRYTANTGGCSVYTWNVSSNGTVVLGGGSADDFMEVIWHSGPEGWIELSVSGCPDDFCHNANRFRIPIISPDGPISGDALVCGDAYAIYSAPWFPGASYTWQVGPFGEIISGHETNAIVVQWNNVVTPITSFVEVIYDNCFLECGGRASLDVTISPNLFIQGDHKVCEGRTGFFTATAGSAFGMPVNVAWHIEDQSGTILYLEPGMSFFFNHAFHYPPGVYAVVATNMSPLYCDEVKRTNIQVIAQPESPLAILGDTLICPGESYYFSIASAGVYTTQWTIIDGISAYLYTGDYINHVFGPTPPYVVEAVHIDILHPACWSLPVILNLSTPDEIVVEGPGESCLYQIDQFNIALLNGIEEQWELLPPDAGELRRTRKGEVEVYWTTSGIATLRMRACGYTVDRVITVHDLPVISLSGPAGVCAGDSAAMSIAGSYSTMTWTDEAGMVISIADSARLVPGTYSIEVLGGFGCANTTTFTVLEYPIPQVQLTTPHNFFDCGSPSGGAILYANIGDLITDISWFLDDGEMGIHAPSIPVTTFGDYHAEVTNSYGCKAVTDKMSFINCCDPEECNGPPGADLFPGCSFVPSTVDVYEDLTVCDHHIFSLDMSSVVPGSVQWIIQTRSKGLIDIVTGDVLDYTYNWPGYYQIWAFYQLTGFSYDEELCGHALVFMDTVRAVARMRYDGICAGTPFNFSDHSVMLPVETIATWAWEFGDPGSGSDNFSDEQHPTHVYASGGMYQVQLTITLASGCTASRQMIIEVRDAPAIMPDYIPMYCENEPLSFELTGDLMEITWDFGDPASGDQNSAIGAIALHTWDNPGMYLVTVSAVDNYGCSSQSTLPLDIAFNALSGSITTNPDGPVCEGETIELSAPSGGVSWLWNTGETTATLTIGQTGYYSVQLRDENFCRFETPPAFIEIIPLPEVAVYVREISAVGTFGPWQSTLAVCYGTSFEIMAVSGGQVTYQWAHGATSPNLSFSAEMGNLPFPGLHVYTVEAVDIASDCASEPVAIAVEIYEVPNKPNIVLAGGTGCSFNENFLEVTNPQANVHYVWSDAQTGTHIAAWQAGQYTVTAVSEYGCAVVSDAITIYPSARVDQLPGGCHIACDPLKVCLPALNDVTGYTIYHNGLAVETGTVFPEEFIATADGIYTFEITTGNGCSAVSDPLDITRYTGMGSITVITLFDTDGDGVISVGDTPLSGIPVIIQSHDLLHLGATKTVDHGVFVFTDYPAAGYNVWIDRDLLPSQWVVLIDSVEAYITTCGDSVIVKLLLGTNCVVTGVDVNYTICPGEQVTIGDSTWTDIGVYEMHMLSSTGCDSVFQVTIGQRDSLIINIAVWMDIDGNGILSSLDTLVSGMIIYIEDPVTGLLHPVSSLGIGFTGDTLPTAMYKVELDTVGLPQSWVPIYVSENVPDEACGNFEINFLLSSGCVPVSIAIGEIICPGDSLLVFNQWLSEPGVYSFILPNTSGGCDTLYEVHFSLFEQLSFDVPGEFEIQKGNGADVEITGDTGIPGLIYQWDPPLIVTCPTCVSSTVWATEDTIIHIQIIDSHGCQYDLQTLIRVIEVDDTLIIDHIYVPNVFAPNRDGINDVWRIFSFHELTYGESLLIFDRWGNMVFKKSEFLLNDFEGWDGTFRGKLMNPAVFVYVARIRLANGERVTLSGDITLIK